VKSIQVESPCSTSLNIAEFVRSNQYATKTLPRTQAAVCPQPLRGRVAAEILDGTIDLIRTRLTCESGRVGTFNSFNIVRAASQQQLGKRARSPLGKFAVHEV